MRPVLFEIGGFAIYSYGAMLFLAFSVAIIWSLKEAEAERINQDCLFEIFIMSIILSLLGSRLTYVFLNRELFIGQPWWKIFAFREGGLTFHGGLILALLGGVFYSNYRKILFLKYVDYLSPFIILGYAITRIGCFLNGCCYGHITDLPWGVVYPIIDSYPRHPTQLYASLAALIIFFMLRYLKKYKYFHGYIFLYFIIFYGVYRFLVEYFRVSTTVLWGLSQAQIASLIFIIFGALLLLYQKYRYKGRKA